MAVNSNFTRLISRQKESGLTVKMFCGNEGITPSTFYYWQRKIRKEEGVSFYTACCQITAATRNYWQVRGTIPGATG